MPEGTPGPHGRKERDMKVTQGYQIVIKGESLGDWSASNAENIDVLIKGTNKPVQDLIYKIAQKQVELALQVGDIDSATSAVEQFVLKQGEWLGYSAPKHVFKIDRQVGSIYQGAHCFFGAFRDAGKFMYAGQKDSIFYERGGGGKKKKAENGEDEEETKQKPSNKHLRKRIRVTPNHVFLYRPDGTRIEKADEVQGQNPVPPDVKGFAYYEVVHHPFMFTFNLQVLPEGIFQAFLSDTDRVEKVLRQSTFHGIGGRRSAGYGAWRIVDTKIETGLAY